MLLGKMLRPATGTPIPMMVRMSVLLAVWLPVPFTVATRIVKSFTTGCPWAPGEAVSAAVGEVMRNFSGMSDDDSKILAAPRRAPGATGDVRGRRPPGATWVALRCLALDRRPAADDVADHVGPQELVREAELDAARGVELREVLVGERDVQRGERVLQLVERPRAEDGARHA